LSYASFSNRKVILDPKHQWSRCIKKIQKLYLCVYKVMLQNSERSWWCITLTYKILITNILFSKLHKNYEVWFFFEDLNHNTQIHTFVIFVQSKINIIFSWKFTLLWDTILTTSWFIFRFLWNLEIQFSVIFFEKGSLVLMCTKSLSGVSGL
jgi:hypothetical protein